MLGMDSAVFELHFSTHTGGIMKIHGGPSAQALLHTATRSQEAKQPFTLTEETTPTDSGNNVPSTGENLPPTDKTKGPDHATGLERAIERLTLNLAKQPDSKGLQNALEKLQANLNARNSEDPAPTESETTPTTPIETSETTITLPESSQETTGAGTEGETTA